VRTEVREEIASVRGEIASVRGDLAAFREESSRRYDEIVGQMIHIQNSLSAEIQETDDALASLKQEFAETRGEIMSEAREVAREAARAEGMAWRQAAGERAGEAGPG